MSEQASKKIKIYKLSTELNLSSDTIIEFLRKKGFDVKGHMTTVSDDMMQAIMNHFKKDKDVAERHQKKVQEFRTSRTRNRPLRNPPLFRLPKLRWFQKNNRMLSLNRSL